ncbi:TRAP transporter small permease [Neobacillus mesonae]|uniref:TRAP transporter small permease n=1 Tax=Neobacillus mesonae TaxID=1193713 RepID=UPI00203D3ABC|nr:TRAP transporter small permease subunit [Neobacillus mesonae]MCM3569042.1 TRAP transporter small permease subunit [Neobacillus mesonae]
MKKIIDRIANLYLFVALIAFLGLIVLLTMEVTSRYFFHYSFVWSQEFASILICWITFLGFGKIVVIREDISITFLVQKCNAKIKKLAGAVNSILLFAVSFIMLIFTTKLTISHLEKMTTIMKASSAWFIAPLAFLMILIVLYSIHQLIMVLTSQLDLFAAEEGDQ